MDRWIDFLTGRISAAAGEPLLVQAVEELDARLDAQPQLTEHILEIIATRLGDQIDEETWTALDASLTNCLGRNLAYLMIWLVQTEQGERLDELEKHASPQAMAFLRTVLGLYGDELARALGAWNELPHNWRTISREVYYDQITQLYRMQVRIEKYNGEQLFLEGPADSILTLTSYFLLTARLAGTPDAFSQEVIDLFLEQAREFLWLLPQEQIAEFVNALKTGTFDEAIEAV